MSQFEFKDISYYVGKNHKKIISNAAGFVRNKEVFAILGPSGAGKTSLLNQIWNDLEKFNKEDDSIDDFKQIWINSWEHSLLCSPEECLMKIINEIKNEK